jgi:hypothetical protein
MLPGTLEITDIKKHLDKLASSGALNERTTEACTKAGMLLLEMRKIIIGLQPEEARLEDYKREFLKLREFLAQQGEG